jgi:hypothetical protein
MKYSLLLLLGLCTVAACGDEPDEPDLHFGDPWDVVLVSNDDQNVRPGAQVDVTVEVRDIDGRALYDSRVTWSVHAYSNELFVPTVFANVVGSVTPATSFTNADGQTDTRATLPQEYGWYAVTGAVTRENAGIVVTRAKVAVTDGTAGTVDTLSGTNQTARLGVIMAEPLVVQVREANGQPAINTEVRFTNTGYGGAPFVDYVRADGTETYSYSTTTDALGRASVRLRPMPQGTASNVITVVVGVPRFGRTIYVPFTTSP